MSLVFGVGALNVLLLGVGYCVLSGSLWGRNAACWLSYAGVALLTGAGVTVTGVFVAYILGAPNGAVALGAAAGVAVVIGLAAARLLRWRDWASAPQAPRRNPPSRSEAMLETTLFAGVAVVALAALIGGFRSSPWLDDVWGIWVPKAVALDKLGLDARIFAPNGTYEAFGVLHYPLWWSSLTGLDLRFVGSLDLRAVNAQTTLLVLAFLGAAARLLWGHVRPWLLGASLLLIAATPELFRHAQGGLADVPLALYLSLAALAGIGWLASGSGFHLVLAVAFGLAAVQIKSEGLPELLVVAAFTLLLASRVAPRRLPALFAGWTAAFATATPWLAWRVGHDVPGEVPVSNAFDPGYLLDRSDRVGSSADTIAHHLLTPREWLLIVPIALALALLAAVRERRLLYLAPWLLVGTLFLFWVWVYWAHPDSLDYILSTSAYRVADATVLLAWVAIPLLSERMLQTISGR